MASSLATSAASLRNDRCPFRRCSSLFPVPSTALPATTTRTNGQECVRACSTALPAGRLELTRVRDANEHGRCSGGVRALQWQPRGALLLAAGLDKRLSFFAVDGTRNAPVQSLFLADLPVHTAHFVAGGTQVVAAGRRPFFYVADLASQAVLRIKGLHGRADASLERFVVPPADSAGDDQRACLVFLGTAGALPLVSVRSHQLVGQLQMSGTVRAAAFSPDGLSLYAAGGDGYVHLWDVRMRRCRHRFVDDACVRSSALAVSNSTLAAASHAGVVNIYDRIQCLAPAATDTVRAVRAPVAAAAVQPKKRVTNLVTRVDALAFSSDGALLCVASPLQKNALRVVHVPSLTVFSNWPTARSPLHAVHSVAFSPSGAFLAVGNARGHVLTYRLHHYAGDAH